MYCLKVIRGSYAYYAPLWHRFYSYVLLYCNILNYVTKRQHFENSPSQDSRDGNRPELEDFLSKNKTMRSANVLAI